MKRTSAILLVLPLALVMSAHTPYAPTDSYQTILQRELLALQERGLSYVVHDTFVEAIDPLTQQRWTWPLDALEPREAPMAGLPTLTIDLRTIDTSLYNWKYHYVTSFPISSEWGFPLQVKDFDDNGLVEAYGIHQTQTEYLTQAFEKISSISWTRRHTYEGLVGIPNSLGDVDNDGLLEVLTIANNILTVFTQPAPDVLPTIVKFEFNQWHFQTTGIPNEICDMDDEGFPEMIYAGSEEDSVVTSIRKTYVATYDSAINNFHRRWSERLAPSCIHASDCTGQIAVGDFDGDGLKEFVTSSFRGNVYVVEYVQGDSFRVVWSDSLSVAGRVAAGDVDGNGITEFFVGGNQVESDGLVHLRGYAYERTGDNSYEPVFAFNIFPVAYFYVDLYQTTDIDGDGVPELLLSTGGGSLIIKGAGEHAYELFYYRAFPLAEAFSARSTGEGLPHLFVSKHNSSQPSIKSTDEYRPDSLITVVTYRAPPLPVNFEIRNFPNPFNASVRIVYQAPFRGHVTLTLFDITGKKVATLVNEIQEAGRHTTHWRAASVASGVYLLRLRFDQQSQTAKLVYLK